ncbi:L-rhamnose-binding lectin CSL3-like [Nelusetta ayraudi]|uniref:L-rhamnose-binding lectin CSL3-like n=1 Tax=Nelusetta ayraudi TaxID=303726 RepID=UPI003F6F31A6
MLSAKLTIVAMLAASGCWLSEGYVDVACPGQNNILQCPEGKIIQLQSMGHGNSSGMACYDRTTPRQLQDDHCLHSSMQGWAKFICDGLDYCRLPKPHRNMFVCSNNTDDFLQVTYDCVDRSPGERSVVTCDGGHAEVKCESGVISIKRAIYGRVDEDTCTDHPSVMTFCRSSISDITVRRMCDNRTECRVPVKRSALGKPRNCDGKPKYLTVAYTCQ